MHSATGSGVEFQAATIIRILTNITLRSAVPERHGAGVDRDVDSIELRPEICCEVQRTAGQADRVDDLAPPRDGDPLPKQLQGSDGRPDALRANDFSRLTRRAALRTANVNPAQA